jgi:hypothetical protein
MSAGKETMWLYRINASNIPDVTLIRKMITTRENIVSGRNAAAPYFIQP